MKTKVSKTLIRRYISQLGITQVEAARRIGVSDRTMRVYCAKGAPQKIDLAFKQLLSEK